MSQQSDEALNKGIDGAGKAGGTAAKGVGKAAGKLGKAGLKKLGKGAAKEAATAVAAPEVFLIKAAVIAAIIIIFIIIAVVFGATGPGMSKTNYLTANNETEMNEPKEKDQKDAIYEKSKSTDETAELIGIIQDKKATEKEKQIKLMKNMARQYGCDPDLTEQHMVDETETGLSDDVSAANIKASAAKTKTWKFLKANGYSDEAAAGIMGNIQAESHFDPAIIEKANGVGYGLIQWSYSRRTALNTFAQAHGQKVSSIDIQLDFMLHEFKTSYKLFYSKKFKSSKSIEYTTRAVLEHYEKPAEIEQNYKKRLSYAKGIYKKYAGMDAGGEVKDVEASEKKKASLKVSASESPFFDALNELAKDITKNKFKYDSNTNEKTYEKSLKGRKRVDCKAYVSWALQKANLIPKNKLFWCHNSGEIRKNKKLMTDKKNFYTRQHVQKKLGTLVKNGDIKPGDIIGSGNGESHHTMVYKGKAKKGKRPYIFFSIGGNAVRKAVQSGNPKKITENHRSGNYKVGVIIRPKNAGSFSSSDTEAEGNTASGATRSDFDILAAYSVSVGNSEMELVDEESSKENSDGEKDNKTYTDITGHKIPLYWWGEKRGLPNYKKDLKKKLRKNDTPFYKMVYATKNGGKVDFGTAKVDGKEVKYLKATLKERDVTKEIEGDKEAGIKSIAESAFNVKPNKKYVGTGNTNAVAIKGIGEESYQLLGNGEEAASASVVYGKGEFAMPLGKAKYVLTSKYNEARSYENHPGCDMAMPQGTKIYAAAAGKVSLAGRYDGYGYCIIIDHGGGLQTLYGHQPCMGKNGVMVKKGHRVVKGQCIGHVGSTGRSTGPHLHFEVRKNGKPVDPSPYLGRKVS